LAMPNAKFNTDDCDGDNGQSKTKAFERHTGCR